MPLKEKFLSYVEMQRSANDRKTAYGPDDIRTVEAYQKANDMKRNFMNQLEELEYRMESLEK
jgi:hypothetical protein